MNGRSLLLIPALTAALPCPAQSPDAPAGLPGLMPPAPERGEPAELSALRHFYAESLAAADADVHARWKEGLAGLEKARAATGDYAGAARVRSRREAVIALPGFSDGRAILKLSAEDVTNQGSGLTTSGKTITLSSKGAFIEWDRPSDHRGWYEVRLTHAVDGPGNETGRITPVTGPLPADRRSQRPGATPPASGGWISFQNVSGFARNEQMLRREIVSTGGWNAWATVPLGRLELKGRVKFRLTADEAGRGPVMHFRGIELVPSAPPGPDASEGAARLAKARETFDKTFRLQTAAANARYRESLNQLEQEALHARDTDMVVRVKEEKSLLAGAPDKLALEENTGQRAILLNFTTAFGSQFRGEIRYEAKAGRLTGLRPAGTAAVTWRLPVFNVGSGIYRVTVKGRVPVNGGGSALLTPFAPTGNTPSGKPLTLQIKPVITAEARNKKPDAVPAALDLDAGLLTIPRGSETLTLSVDSLIHPDGSLAELTSLTLTRQGEAGPAAAP